MLCARALLIEDRKDTKNTDESFFRLHDLLHTCVLMFTCAVCCCCMLLLLLLLLPLSVCLCSYFHYLVEFFMDVIVSVDLNFFNLISCL